MREIQVPAIATLSPEANLAGLPRKQAAQRPQRAVMARRIPGGWQDVTAAEFAAEVDALAKGLIAAGLEPGDRLALMSATRYEWTLIDFAAWTAGLVVVPVYETSSPDQLAWIVQNSGAVALFVENAARRAIADEVRDQIAAVVHLWQIDGGDIDGLISSGRSVDEATLDERRRFAKGDTLATIIYTSGTTGRPKGCMLTHANFLALAENAADRLADVVRREEASTILFLPLAHVFARFIEVICVEAGVKMAHSLDIKGLTNDFGTYHPTFVLSVPRVFEKIYNSAEQKAMAEGKGRIFKAAARCAEEYSRAQDAGGPGLALKVQHFIYDKLVYAKLRTVLGGSLRYAISGGAPLSLSICHFFRGIGVTVLEGYGLTETTAPVGVNTPDLSKIGTVGRPLPGCGVRIGEDGEITVKGVCVFKGYWQNEAATADVFEDGWFKTGDLGKLDDEGFLAITGRKKEILITAGGKNVVPAQLEDRIRTNPLVSQCIVVGDRRPFVGALVTLDLEMIPIWAKANGHSDLTTDNAPRHPAVRAEIDKAIAGANTAVSKAESIRKFTILDTDFTEANGYLTPSMKIKRNVVMQDFDKTVEDLYSGGGSD